MAVKVNYDINKLFNSLKSKVKEVSMAMFKEVVEKTMLEIVVMAKQTNTYKDRTNNLRSSIGYVIYVDGKKLSEYFVKAGSGKDGGGNKGIEQGRVVANDIAKMYGTGIVGVVVAGAEYAVCVESKGFDVISSSGNKMKKIFEKNLKLSEQAKKK